jgi:hypothetical protein
MGKMNGCDYFGYTFKLSKPMKKYNRVISLPYKTVAFYDVTVNIVYT